MSKIDNYKITKWATFIIIFVLIAILIVIQYFWIAAMVNIRRSVMTESLFLAFNDCAYEMIMMHNEFETDPNDINESTIVQIEEMKKHKMLIDSTIGHYMENSGIHVPYYWAVVEKNETKTIIENDLLYLKNQEKPVQTYRVSSLYNQFPYELVVQLFSVRWQLPGVAYYTIFALGVCLIILILGIIYNSWLYNKRQKEIDFWMDFIGNLVHEFKTPMATISLASEMMIRTDVVNNKERIVQYSSLIYKENRHLREMIDKLLQTISLDMNAMTLNFAPVDVHEEIKRIAESFALRIEEKEGTLTLNLNAEDSVVLGDKMHLLNVISNLVENAEKYSDETLCITIETRNDYHGLYVSIKDQGRGISSEHVGKLFNKFYRVRSIHSYSESGYGLGLFYVSYVMHAHNGNIRVMSKEGQGSTFELYFPYYH